MNIKSFIFFVCFFFGILSVRSQSELFNDAPLKKVLFVLEKKFDVKFSFSEDDITSQLITANIKGDILDDVLRKLESQTTLSFKKVTKRYIAILSKTSEIQVCGIVVDNLSQKPLFGASIVNSEKTKGTSSNKSGYFHLKKISENDSISISFLGYRPLVFSAKALRNSPCITISLHQTTAVLSEVIIRNYLTGGMVKKTDGF